MANDRRETERGHSERRHQDDDQPRGGAQLREEPTQRPRRGPHPVNEQAEAELKASRAASSIGAQVILDYNEDGSLGARGGAAGTIEENTMARDAWLGEMGLDPMNCSGPARAKVEAEAEARPALPLPDARATRASSLAAGISQGARP